MTSSRLEDIVNPKSLYSLPEKYRVSSKIHREDGLLSAQMLNGIPEFDLGVNNKLKNIERTETAKRLMGSVDNFIDAINLFTGGWHCSSRPITIVVFTT